jgi:hypothetical protein
MAGPSFKSALAPLQLSTTNAAKSSTGPERISEPSGIFIFSSFNLAEPFCLAATAVLTPGRSTASAGFHCQKLNFLPLCSFRASQRYRLKR